MKKKIFIIVSVVVVLLVTIVCIVLLGNGKSGNNTTINSTDTIISDEKGDVGLFLCDTKADLETFAKKSKSEIFYDEDYAWISGIEMFSQMADAEVVLKDTQIKRISMNVTLMDIPYPEVNDSEDENSTEDIEEDYIPYDFTEEEQLEANYYFAEAKRWFESFLGCGEINQYDVIKTGNADGVDLSAMSEEEQFLEGYIVKEYSVRDTNGVLWLLRFSSSDYNTTAIIVKLMDETGFEGFVPIVDLTKKVG